MKSMLNLADDLSFAGVYLERAELTIGEVVEGFFDTKSAHHNDTALNEARIMAEICRTCLFDLHNALGDMGATVASLEHPDPVQRLEWLGITATRRGKGAQWTEVLERHGVTCYADLPLGKYRALEADMATLLEV